MSGSAWIHNQLKSSAGLHPGFAKADGVNQSDNHR